MQYVYFSGCLENWPRVTCSHETNHFWISVYGAESYYVIWKVAKICEAYTHFVMNALEPHHRWVFVGFEERRLQ